MINLSRTPSLQHSLLTSDRLESENGKMSVGGPIIQEVKITLYVRQHHLDCKHYSLLWEGWRLADSCCEYPGWVKIQLSGPCGCPFLMSCLQWRPLRWSCATAVPPSPWSALSGEMSLLLGRRCCHGWVRRKWCLCRYQLKSLEGSCSCSAPIPCALHCHTISHRCEHWRHCWRVYCCWNGWNSGCQTTEQQNYGNGEEEIKVTKATTA